MMEGGVFADFTLLWMLAHRSRFARGMSDTGQCFLELWYKLPWCARPCARRAP